MIKAVLLSGITDIDIRHKALITDRILDKSVANVIAFIENRETA